jgi:hypothetical protein
MAETAPRSMGATLAASADAFRDPSDHCCDSVVSKTCRTLHSLSVHSDSPMLSPFPLVSSVSHSHPYLHNGTIALTSHNKGHIWSQPMPNSCAR